jgi:hypothetical protein
MIKKLKIISDNEKNELLNFVNNNKHLLSNTKKLQDGKFIEDSSRQISVSLGLNFPDLAIAIQKRIRKEFPFLQKEFDLFQNGMTIGIINSPGDFYEHTDTNYKKDGLSVVGFNLLISKPENGGITYVEGMPYEIEENEILAYLISDYKHSVSKVFGNKSRISWYWRFYVNKEEWENQIN